MRKLLISILIVLLLLITVYSIWKGLSIGNIKILGFNNIKSESDKLDSQIDEITKIKSQNYKKALSDIESNAKTLLQEKEEYATLVSTSTDSEIQKATHKQTYEQDFLWAKIGNHATAQGVTLKFDIAVGTVNKDNYDLHFTVTGTYTNITEFVLALENDNLLGFKIENFKLVPNSSSSSSSSTNKKNNTNNTNTNNTTSNTTNTTNTTTTTTTSTVESLKATFKVTDISINIDKTKVTTASANRNTTTENQAGNTTNSVDNTTTTTNTNTNNTVTEGTVEED